MAARHHFNVSLLSYFGFYLDHFWTGLALRGHFDHDRSSPRLRPKHCHFKEKFELFL